MSLRILDLSVPLVDRSPNCPVHPPVSLCISADHPMDGWRMEEFHMASHTGTHLDAPLHKIAGGKSIDQYPLEAFTGRVVGLDLKDHVHEDKAIDAMLLEKLCPAGEFTDSIVLLETGWGLIRSKTDKWLYRSPYLSPSGAAWLVARGVRGVGIDHFSIGGMIDEENTRTHEILLGAGVWVVEELKFPDGWLSFAKDAVFQALPLHLPGFSGSPCRAVLIQYARFPH